MPEFVGGMFKGGHFNIALNTRPVLCRIAPWECFGGCCRFFFWSLRGWTGNWVKIGPQKQSHSAIRLNSDPVLRAASKFSGSGTLGRMGSSFRRSNFWNDLGGQTLSNDWSMVFESTIDKSEVTPFHPHDPRNHWAESLYPFSLLSLQWRMANLFVRNVLYHTVKFMLTSNSSYRRFCFPES